MAIHRGVGSVMNMNVLSALNNTQSFVTGVFELACNLKKKWTMLKYFFLDLTLKTKIENISAE